MHLGCGIDHLPYSSTEVKEKVQLYVNPLSLCLQGMLQGELLTYKIN